MPQICICAKFDGKFQMIAEYQGHKVNMFYGENYLYSRDRQLGESPSVSRNLRINLVWHCILSPCWGRRGVGWVGTGGVNTLRLRQNGTHFTDNILKYIFVNENFWFSYKIALKWVPCDLSDDQSALVEVMIWHWIGDKLSPQPMMIPFTNAYQCISLPKWVNHAMPVMI